MNSIGFTLQDILGVSLAFAIFPVVIVFPGYVFGWALDLLDFRKRQPLVKLGLGLVLSTSIVPILLDLTSRLFSINFSILILAGSGALFVLIFFKDNPGRMADLPRPAAIALWGVGGLFVFVIFSLINIQWQDQLYVSAVADQITRVSVINAITRTGVPPLNPGFFPGHAVPLTGLFYFWYSLCSVVDLMGGHMVDARAALTASSIWSGIGLMAVVGLYLRQRNAVARTTAWRSAKLGFGLLLVGGLDALLLFLFSTRLANIVNGREGLSMVQSMLIAWRNLEYFVLTLLGYWINSILWIPHHIAGVIASFTAVLLAQSARGRKPSAQIVVLGIAGLALASSAGLSTWVTIPFSIFWAIWILVLFLQKTDRSLAYSMIGSALIAILVAGPFLLGARGDESAGGSRISLALGFRTLPLLETFIRAWPVPFQWLARLAVLPFGYLVEMGFLFATGIYWVVLQDKKRIASNPFHLPEVILVAVVFCTSTFVRVYYGTLELRDLGWRGWLLGLFVLLIWTVDILPGIWIKTSKRGPAKAQSARDTFVRYSLYALIAIGLLTTLCHAIFARTFVPVLAGEEANRRAYSARLAYEYLRDHVPAKVIVQYNPARPYDAPAGLYGTHQMLISDITAYALPEGAASRLKDEMVEIFSLRDATHWRLIDRVCRRRSLGVLVIEDTDPLWSSLPALKVSRPPIYENSHYALYACGDYSGE